MNPVTACCLHVIRHRLVHAVIAAGVGAGAGGTAVHHYAVPAPVRVASVGCAGAAAAISPGLNTIQPAAFVTPVPAATLFGSPSPDGVPVIRVDDQQSVPEPSWGVIGLAGSIVATVLLIAVWPRR